MGNEYIVEHVVFDNVGELTDKESELLIAKNSGVIDDFKIEPYELRPSMPFAELSNFAICDAKKILDAIS